jgi:Haem-NO-binding
VSHSYFALPVPGIGPLSTPPLLCRPATRLSRQIATKSSACSVSAAPDGLLALPTGGDRWHSAPRAWQGRFYYRTCHRGAIVGSAEQRAIRPMKGIVFTEFLEMVEGKFSAELVDRIVQEAELASGGVYTSVGTYDHVEMISLVSCLSKETGISPPELMKVFGEYLFGRFAILYPRYFEGVNSSFRFLSNVEDYIHVEVRKLYPEAELPSFRCDESQPGRLRLTYQSTRPFAPLAEGLIRGCLAHFGENADIQIEDLSAGAGTAARFVVTQRDAPRE